MKKKDKIGLQRNNKTKINPHCGVKTDYWTREARYINVCILFNAANYIALG